MSRFFLKVVAAPAMLGATLALPANAILSFSEDFESLSVSDPAALTNSGWLVFGNVYDSGGNLLFGYGVFGAPNGGPAFSAVVDDQGGGGQGNRQLSVYNDYDCCQPANGHFGAGTDLVESIVFQEFTITAEDVGVYTFDFDAKKGNIDLATTANGFIKTLDPDAGFALTSFVEADTTSTPDTWSPYSMDITIDPGLVGQILQLGFSSTASAFQGSGIFYDNVRLRRYRDFDEDLVPDAFDNCLEVPNPGQEDSNGDATGNICDADITGPGDIEDCLVNFLDLQAVKDAFFSNPAAPNWNPDADLDSSDLINFSDLQIVKDQFFGPPGRSAAGCNCRFCKDRSLEK